MRRGPGTVKRQEMPTPQGGVVKRANARAVLVTLGIGIVFLACQIDLSVVAVGRKPRGTGRKACICRRIPLERSPGIITADAVYGL